MHVNERQNYRWQESRGSGRRGRMWNCIGKERFQKYYIAVWQSAVAESVEREKERWRSPDGNEEER